MTDKVTVANLAIADFYADRSVLTDATKRWMDGNLNSQVLGAENCERRIWLGHIDTITQIPDIPQYAQRRIYTGAAAYAFALRYISGVANPNGLDRPAYDRFFQSTAKMVSRNPKHYKNFHELIGMLAQDSGFIISNICDRITPIRPWLIARELSKQAKGSKILIIGELQESDPTKISDVTQRMIVTSNGQEHAQPSQLRCITLGGGDACEITRNKLTSLIKTKKLRIPEIEVETTENLAKAIEEADVVYVTFPLGQRPEFDRALKSMWKNRLRTDNTLMHTNIRNMDTSSLRHERLFQGVPYYIPASIIRFYSNSRQEDYDAKKRQIESIANDFSTTRLQKQTPVRDINRYPLRQFKMA